MDARLKALGLTVTDVGDSACDGCKGQPLLKHDADCYLTCETFEEEVKRLEEDSDGQSS